MEWKSKGRDIRILMGMVLLLPFLLVPPLVYSLLSGATYGPIKLDGSVGDWPGRYRLDLPPWQAPMGTELYGAYEGGAYVFAIVSPNIQPGVNVTIWLNTDRNPNTGHLIWGNPSGAEYNVDFAVGNDPYLYTGAPGATRVSEPLGCGVGVGAVELAIPATLLANAPKSIDVLVDIGDSLYIPSDYSQRQFTVGEGFRPPRTNNAKRVGIVFSRLNGAKFYDAFAYSQLVMALQHQSMMAGIPYDVLEDSALEDVRNLVNYDALVLPYQAHVDPAKLAATNDALTAAVYAYHIGLMAAGNVLTNDTSGAPLPGDSYSRQRALLGVGPVSFHGPVSGAVRAVDTTHPVMVDYSPSETILTYDPIWYGNYAPQPGVAAWTLANLQTQAGLHPAMTATYTGGRNVFFANEQVMADGNLAWAALRWIVHGSSLAVGLLMSRQNVLFFARNDMDQSMFPDEIDTVERPLLSLITSWKQRFGFVGSYYINVGNRPGAGESTDWNVSGPLYRSYIALGSEIGTHSYTHPDYTSNLSPSQLDFEFRDSRDVIAQGVPAVVDGAAIPGNPETLAVDKQIMPYFTYVSGRYAGKGSGYPGAIGTLAPDITGTYMCLGMSPDFTLIGFKRLSSQAAEAVWSQEFDKLTTHANLPVVHWMWHDYGPTTSLAEGYSVQMYESLIAKARDRGAEFVTGRDLQRRMAAFRAAGVELKEKDGLLTATVKGTGLGSCALEIESAQIIKRVNKWYAYDDHQIFLPLEGRKFEIELGTEPDRVTRITQLPMRAQLMNLSGDGVKLSFGLLGEGQVKVALGDFGRRSVNVKGATSHSIDGDTLTLNFAKEAMYSVSISAK